MTVGLGGSGGSSGGSSGGGSSGSVGAPIRHYKVVHELVSLTGVNFVRKSVVGFVEISLLPSKESLKHIRLNAKQCKVYRVVLNNQIEAPFQYCDPMLEIVDKDSKPWIWKHSQKPTWRVQSRRLGSQRRGIKHQNPKRSQSFGVHGQNPQSGHRIQSGRPAGRNSLRRSEQRNRKFILVRFAHVYLFLRKQFPTLVSLHRYVSELCTWKLEFTVDEHLTAISTGDLTETIYTPDLKRKNFPLQRGDSDSGSEYRPSGRAV